MTITWYSIIGFLAAAVTIVMYMPQSFSVVKNKKTGTLSKSTFMVIFVGCLAWILYTGVPLYTHSKDAPTVVSMLPTWITNITITFLMMPIVWYLYDGIRNRKTIFLASVVGAILVVILSCLIMFDKSLWGNFFYNTGGVFKYVFVILAGAATGLPFVPQVIKIMKQNLVGDINIKSTWLIILGNLLFATYWVGNLIATGDGSMYISLIFALFGALLQLPILYVYMKNSKKSKA